MKILLLGVDNQRTRCYLYNLLNKFPHFSISLALLKPTADIQNTVQFMSRKRPEYFICPITNVKWNSNYNFESDSRLKDVNIFKTNTVNCKDVYNHLSTDTSDYILYSGIPGQIISDEIINVGQDKIIHAHPGLLPYYKGSTTFLYSAFIEKNISSTVFKITSDIDSGKILKQVTYSVDRKISHLTFERITDSAIRWISVEKLFLEGEDLLNTKENLSDEGTFYIMHPILRTLLYLK